MEIVKKAGGRTGTSDDLNVRGFAPAGSWKERRGSRAPQSVCLLLKECRYRSCMRPQLKLLGSSGQRERDCRKPFVVSRCLMWLCSSGDSMTKVALTGLCLQQVCRIDNGWPLFSARRLRVLTVGDTCDDRRYPKADHLEWILKE
jgi:hypothetical protein